MGESAELESSASPKQQLRKNAINHLAFIESTPAVPAILFSQELHSQNDRLRGFFAGLMAQRQKGLARQITAAIDAGEFDKSVNADDAAYLVLALIQGLAMRWSLNSRDFDLVSEGQRLLELLFAGFEKQG